MRRKGFTIVELMMVVGIIGVLLGIVTTIASSSVKTSRRQRATSLCTLVQSGLAAYYAQEGEWPTSVCNQENPSPRKNREADDKNDPNKIVLNADEVRECVYKMVMLAKENRPVIDVTGLFVSKKGNGRHSQVCFGMDFMSAIRGTRETVTRMTPEQMAFGYPEEEHGHFRHFKMVYSIPTDTITVSKMDDDKSKADSYE